MLLELSLTTTLQIISKDFSMKKIKFGETTKLLSLRKKLYLIKVMRVTKAYMIISGRLTVLVDNVRVGSMSDGGSIW